MICDHVFNSCDLPVLMQILSIDLNKVKFDADHSFWLIEVMLEATRRLSLRNMKLPKKTTYKWQNYSFK